MMTELVYIFKYVRDLLSHTEEVWTRLRDPNVKEAQPEYMLRYYYWPLVGAAAICIFILHGNGIMVNSKLPYDAPFSIEDGLKGMASFVLGYSAGPALAIFVIREIICNLSGWAIDKRLLEVFVHYNISIVLLVDLLCAFMPSMTFLSFIALYVMYLVWMGGMVLFEFYSMQLRLFTFVSFLAIYFSADILQGILRMLFAI